MLRCPCKENERKGGKNALNTDDVDALRNRYVASAVTLEQLCRESGANLDDLRRLCRRQQWNRLRQARAASRLESAEATRRTL